MNMLPYRAKGLCRHVKIKNIENGKIIQVNSISLDDTFKNTGEETRRVNWDMLPEKD